MKVVESVRAEAARLKAAGVEMVIALGHYGYDEDVAMAQQGTAIWLLVSSCRYTAYYTVSRPLAHLRCALFVLNVQTSRVCSTGQVDQNWFLTG